MVANLETRMVENNTVLNYGLMGSVEAVPEALTELEFVMVAGHSFDEGVLFVFFVL